LGGISFLAARRGGLYLSSAVRGWRFALAFSSQSRAKSKSTIFPKALLMVSALLRYCSARANQ